jgi:tRNA(Ile)-lysidine synthase
LASVVADCLHRHGLDRTTGIVAVSGGPDSIALAHLCVGLLRDGAIARLFIAHVNHQLRGPESDADETFVTGLPTNWQTPDVTCRTTRIDVAAIARAETDNLETIARRERYRWLADLACEVGAAWVATGHSADDQAETVLFRLLRGSGILGLGGISPCRPLGERVQLIRPLLTARRQMLLDYLHERNIGYRLDSSNRDLRFTRNRLRLELLPRLQADYNPAIVEVLCRLAEQAQEVHAEIAAAAARLLCVAELPRAGAVLVFSVERLQNAAPNLVREMFRLVWQREGWPMDAMDFAHWNRLLAILREPDACDFPGRIHVRRAGAVLQIHAPVKVGTDT